MAKKAKKSPAKSRRQPSRKKKPSAQRRRWFSWSFIAKAGLVCLVLGAAGMAYLDALVRERFDSHAWQLPARVYARPVELYEGRVLSREGMLKLLDLMRYRRDARAEILVLLWFPRFFFASVKAPKTVNRPITRKHDFWILILFRNRIVLGPQSTHLATPLVFWTTDPMRKSGYKHSPQLSFTML